MSGEQIKQGYRRTEVGIIPDDWGVDTVESVTPRGGKFGIVDGPFGSNLKTIHYRKSGIPIVTSGYVTEGRFYADSYLYVDKEKFEQEKRSAVKAGDIVMAKIGARCGASAILPNRHEISILSGNALKITVDQSRHDTLYIWQSLWNLYSTGRLDELRTVGAQPAISMANLKKYKLPLPHVHEQRSIATALSDVDALLAKLDELIAKKRDLKQATMQQLLTGQTRLPGFSGEWEVKRLGEVVEIRKGQLITEKDAIHGDIPVIAGGKKPSYFHNRPNRVGKTITVSASGASAGYVAFFDSPIFASDCSTISDGKTYSIVFIYFQLLLKQDEIYRAQTGGAQPHIHAVDLMPLEVGMCSLEEQAAIAVVLSEMDAELAALEARRDKTSALKQGMMQELLTGRIRLV